MAFGGRRQIEIDIIANDEASRVFDKVGDSISSMSHRMNANISRIEQGLHRYNSAMNGVYRSTQVALAGAGYFTYRFVKDSINQFAEFERQHGKTMGAIASNYGRSIDQQRKFMADQKRLKEEALRFGTVGPTGKGSLYKPVDVSKAQTELSKAGVKPGDISSALAPILKFAGGNDLPIETATDFAVNMAKMFDIKPKDWSGMLDKMTRAADISTIDVPDLMETMKYAGPIASAQKRKMDEILAITAIMGNVGLKGSIAGTGVNAFFTRLLSPIGKTEKAMETAPSPKAKKELEKFIESVTTAKGKFKDMTVVTDNLDKSMGKLNDKEQAWFAHKLFGLFQMKAGLTLASHGGSELEGVEQDITKNSPGTNDRKWDIMLNTSWGKWEAVRNAWGGAQTDIGYRLSPVTNQIADQVFTLLTTGHTKKGGYDDMKKAIKDSGKLMGEQYGKQVGDLTESTATGLMKGGLVGGAISPLASGAGVSTFKLLSGDIPGALDSMGKAIDQTNRNIDKLPAELQGLAQSAKQAALALLAITGINFVAKLGESAASIWRATIGQLINANLVRVQGAQVVVQETGLVDKDGNPYVKKSKGGKGGHGGGGSGTIILDKDGNPKKVNGEKPVILGTDGKPIQSTPSTPRKSKRDILNNAGSKLGSALEAYSILETLGLPGYLLDYMGAGDNSWMRTASEYASKGGTALLLDRALLGGAGRKYTGKALSKSASALWSGAKYSAGEVGWGATGVGGGVIGATVGLLYNDYQKRMEGQNIIDRSATYGAAGIPWAWQNDKDIGPIRGVGNKYMYLNGQGVLKAPGSSMPKDEVNRMFNFREQQLSIFGKTGKMLTWDEYSRGNTALMGRVANIEKGVSTPPTVNIDVKAPVVQVDVKVDKMGVPNVTQHIVSSATVDKEYQQMNRRFGGVIK